MNKITKYFLMSICSLILILSSEIYSLSSGTELFYWLSESVYLTLDSVHSVIFHIIMVISFIGYILILYSLARFFIECFRLKENS